MVTFITVFRTESPEKGEKLKRALEEHVRRYLAGAKGFSSAEILLGESLVRVALVEKWSTRQAQIARLQDDELGESLAAVARDALSVEPMFFIEGEFVAAK